ncbi:MAG: hypothetical protein AB7J28_14055 [Hyphomonadaceae bacterium]
MVRFGLFSALVIFAAAAAGCVSAAEDEGRPLPEWFVQERAALDAEGYPDLANVPERVDANTRQPYWDGVTAELEAERRDMQASPRAEAPPTADEQAAAAETFDQGARDALETTRRQH